MYRLLLGVAVGVMLTELLTRERGKIEDGVRDVVGDLGEMVGCVMGHTASIVEEGARRFEERFEEITGIGPHAQRPADTDGAQDDSEQT